uniref:Protein kinase domain-containing protein n=1 Tax=Rhodnius prolixus TaxID=13249 RepID=T1HQ39_RHOPR
MGTLLTTGCWLSLYIALGSLLLFYLPSGPGRDETRYESVGPGGPTQRDPVVPSRLKSEVLVNCTTLEELTDLEWIASGWTKAVYKGRLRGREIAVKTVNLDGHDIETCLSRPERPSLARCYRRASAKILRELILLQELDHPNVIKVTSKNLHF